MSRILICDDDSDLVQLFTERFTGEGYELIACKNGNDTLKLVEEQKPDLVIQDALVPGKHGFEVCKEIKSRSTTKHIPVIMMTAVYTKSRYRQEVISKYGAQDYLMKPIDISDLVARVKKFI
ncbi:MAG TPA: response regulator [Acidobacteriota bacterium]|nr:response regulator [Acidobacteriota bacterium]